MKGLHLAKRSHASIGEGKLVVLPACGFLQQPNEANSRTVGFFETKPIVRLSAIFVPTQGIGKRFHEPHDNSSRDMFILKSTSASRDDCRGRGEGSRRGESPEVPLQKRGGFLILHQLWILKAGYFATTAAHEGCLTDHRCQIRSRSRCRAPACDSARSRR